MSNSASATAFSNAAAATGSNSSPRSNAAPKLSGTVNLSDISAMMPNFELKPKSLYIAVVCKNPFHVAREDSMHLADDGYIGFGYPATKFNPATLLRDTDFLRNGSKAPNEFQKLIELILRLMKRNINVMPSNLLMRQSEPQAAAAPDAPFDKKSGKPLNWFRGYSITGEENMLLSPDKDECYLLLHASRSTLMQFAEKQSLTLRSNPYSIGAGAGFVYSEEQATAFRLSAQEYFRHFDVPPEDEWIKGDKLPDGTWDTFGFVVEVPQKQRLLMRLLREPWLSGGGCGLQLDEMVNDGNHFISNYFVLHNKVYAEEYGLDKFCSLASCACGVFGCGDGDQLTNGLVRYFGENVAIYFQWMRHYVVALSVPAIIGVVCGVLVELGIFPSVVSACFSGSVILWACWFARRWDRAEKRFAIRYGQDVEDAAVNALVRDEFEYVERRRVHVETIYTQSFEWPLSLSRLPDGSMVELVFPNSTRLARRYVVCYPLLILIIGSMVAALFFAEVFRFNNLDSTLLSIVASAISVVVSAIYSKIVPAVIDIMNAYENCTSSTEVEAEETNKVFSLYFVSNYFALGVIMMYPAIDAEERNIQIRTQMLTQLAVMPLVSNALELVLPLALSSLQRRADQLGGYFFGICSYCCCCGCCESCNFEARSKPDENNKKAKVEYEVWKQAQKSPYTSTASEYIEITVQAGYALLFASSFPWAGACLFFQSLLEIKVDASKLLHVHQRPLARTATTIGASTTIFKSLIAVAIVSNAYYLVFVLPTVREAGLATDDLNKYFYFGVLQYSVIGAIILFLAVWQDTSPSAYKNALKIQLLRDRSIQNYITESLKLPHDELVKRNTAPVDVVQTGGGGGGGDDDEEDDENQQHGSGGATSEMEERKKMARPCFEVNRWLTFILTAACIGCGTAAIVLPNWSETSTATFGLYEFCVTATSTCSSYTSTSCASGLSIANRLLLMLILACGGPTFAFIALLIIFCVVPGTSAVVWIRAVALFVSMGCWVCAIVMWQQNFFSCDGSGIANASFGMSFWLAIAAGGSSLIAFVISISMLIWRACCKEDKTQKTKRRRMAAPPPKSVNSASSTTQPDSQQQQQQQQQQSSSMAARPENAYIVPAGVVNYDGAVGAATAAVAAAAAEHREEEEMVADELSTNPADYGLEGDWEASERPGWFWSHENQLFYDAQARQYVSPDGLRLNNETGEWEE